jgi:flagellar hook-associated protein 2
MASITLTPSAATQGTGIDVNAVVGQILDADRAPERVWQAQQTTLGLQSTALNTISSDLADLQSKVDALKDASGGLNAKVASSSQPGILTASTQSSAISSNHLITVTSLATTSTYYTDPVAANGSLGQGSFTLTAGNSVLSVPVNANATLQNVADFINGKNAGVTASVIADSTGSRLAIVSQNSGAAGDFSVGANTTALVFHKPVTGTDASLSIDGVPVSSGSNTVTGAIPGVTLNLASAAPNIEVQLNIANDTQTITQAVSNFVSSYNTLVQAINGQFSFDSASNTGAPLAGNSSLRSLQTSLLNDVTYSITGNNGFVNLESLGIQLQNDGTLTVNSSTLNSVLGSHSAEFNNFFQALNNGFAVNFSKDLATQTDPTQGIIGLNITEIQNTQADLTRQINDFEDRLTSQQQQLIAKYSQVDAQLRQLPLILNQITAQLGSLPHS